MANPTAQNDENNGYEAKGSAFRHASTYVAGFKPLMSAYRTIVFINLSFVRLMKI